MRAKSTWIRREGQGARVLDEHPVEGDTLVVRGNQTVAKRGGDHRLEAPFRGGKATSTLWCSRCGDKPGGELAGWCEDRPG